MALAVLVLTVPYRAGTNDAWTQILTGNIILSQGFPRHDVLSYTASDHAWAEHEWLACIVFALLWNVAGVPGLVVWRGLVVGLTY
jgi:hypothetical protein